MPKLAAAVLLLALAALSGTLSYAGYLVVSLVAEYLDIGRFAAGFLLGVVFARLPWLRNGKFSSIGLLPARARRPLMLALLAFCLLDLLYRGQMLPALFPGFAAAFLLGAGWLRKTVVKRALSSLFGAAAYPPRSGGNDNTIIDAEFREKKD